MTFCSALVKDNTMLPLKRKMNETLTSEWERECYQGELWTALQTCKVDLAAGMSSLESLWRRGSILSGFYIGFIYEYGSFGSSVNYRLAEEWLDQSSRLGSVEATFHLAKLFQKREKFDAAIEKYLDLENVDFPPAFHAMGCLYVNGEGVEKSISRALEHFSQGASLGHLRCTHWYYHLTRNSNITIKSLLYRIIGRIKLSVLMLYFLFLFENSNQVRV